MDHCSDCELLRVRRQFAGFFFIRFLRFVNGAFSACRTNASYCECCTLYEGNVLYTTRNEKTTKLQKRTPNNVLTTLRKRCVLFRPSWFSACPAISAAGWCVCVFKSSANCRQRLSRTESVKLATRKKNAHTNSVITAINNVMRQLDSLSMTSFSGRSQMLPLKSKSLLIKFEKNGIWRYACVRCVHAYQTPTKKRELISNEILLQYLCSTKLEPHSWAIKLPYLFINNCYFFVPQPPNIIKFFAATEKLRETQKK